MFIAALSLFTVGAALSIGTARAADNVTEDQVLQALTPAKKPLTRSLSMGAPTQAGSAATEAERTFVTESKPTASSKLAAGLPDRPSPKP
jgi:hypothetical protein